MLSTPTPFGQVGSFALHTDVDLPESQQRPELVRIMRLAPEPERLVPGERVTMAMVAFPLRAGASGNKLVPVDALLDPTPLSKDEERELADGERALRGTTEPPAGPRGKRLTPRQKQLLARCIALRDRLLNSRLAAPLLARAEALAAKQRRAA